MRQIGIGTLAAQSFLIAEFDFDPRNKSLVTSSIGSNGDQPAEQESASRSRYDSSSNEIDSSPDAWRKTHGCRRKVRYSALLFDFLFEIFGRTVAQSRM